MRGPAVEWGTFHVALENVLDLVVQTYVRSSIRSTSSTAKVASSGASATQQHAARKDDNTLAAATATATATAAATTTTAASSAAMMMEDDDFSVGGGGVDEEEEREVELLRSEVALLVSAAMERVGVKPRAARATTLHGGASSGGEPRPEDDLTRPAVTEDENDYVMIATSFFLA